MRKFDGYTGDRPFGSPKMKTIRIKVKCQSRMAWAEYYHKQMQKGPTPAHAEQLMYFYLLNAAYYGELNAG